jgi:hypothetical protein
MKLFSHDRPALSVAEEWIVTFCSVMFISGLYIDGWAHNHLESSLETFFTPWHALFYGGFGALAAALLALTWRRKKTGRSWKEAVPLGYGWALAGIAIFFVGGNGDMLWHYVFGIEADIEALLSPTHLILAVGFLLMISGPLRAWYLNAEDRRYSTFQGQLPMILSLACVLSLLTFMTQYNHFVEMRAAGIMTEGRGFADQSQSLTVSGFLLQTVLLMGCAFFAMRRSRLMPGALTILFTLNMVAMVLMRDGWILVPSAIIAGIAADLLLPSSYPKRESEREFRLFAFIVPCVLFTGYFLTLLLQEGIWWSIHMWTGSIVIAGIAGLLLSYLVLPPREKHA